MSLPPNKTPLSRTDSVQPAAISFCAKVRDILQLQYLLMYYYSCYLCIFTVFIQPGRVPPKTHNGLVGMEEMVGQGWSMVCVSVCVGMCVCLFLYKVFPNHSLSTPGGLTSNQRQNNNHWSKSVPCLFICEVRWGQSDTFISAATRIW